MGAYEAWCAQKHKLRQSIQEGQDGGGIAYAVRHALAQVEQSTMAQQGDDLLRQQTGILFSCCKTSASLLDVSVATTAWLPQRQQTVKKSPLTGVLWALAAVLQGAVGLYGYAKGLWMLWIPMAAAVAAAMGALLLGKRKRPKEEPPGQVKVTLRPDEEKLFRVLDAQTQAIDRYINDFAYLNEQHAAQEAAPEGKMLSRVADMLEALWEYDDGTGEAAQAAAERMLDSMGLAAASYTPENGHLFTVLPSRDQTKTLVPAIVAKDDRRLLRRGVAAVKMEERETNALYRL